MNIGDFALSATLIERVVNVALHHFRDRSHARLQRVIPSGREINQPLIHFGLIGKPRLSSLLEVPTILLPSEAVQVRLQVPTVRTLSQSADYSAGWVDVG